MHDGSVDGFMKLEEIRQETEEEINRTETLNLARQKAASDLTEQLLELNKHGNHQFFDVAES